MGLVYILPWLIGFLIFKLYPFASSLVYSFSNFHLFKGITEWGVMNYVEAFTSKKITTALLTTIKYSIFTVPLKLVAALFIAYILNFKIKGVNFFRTAYYIPSILGGSVAIAVLWKALFRDEGLINGLLAMFGVQGPSWLSNPDYALFIICILRIWQFGSAMVIFLAALKGVPTELYEAATIDGAGKWRQFRSITLPMITPVVFYNLITQLVQAFQEFNGPYIITQGGPRNSTTLISLLVYNFGFKQNEFGMASALSWIMFIIVMVFTILAFVSQKYWVYYGDEEGK
ncbi:sugar ABC transporter permease [Ruminococcaceae bacterium OttesenSCG-928-A16]|nr:sugar ABC transporter permease [Ruminococcaceae bacterium OttesenSCG-928-A16]